MRCGRAPFPSQTLVWRELGLPDDATRVNPSGGATALGFPFGASDARLAAAAAFQLSVAKSGLCTVRIRADRASR